MSKPEMLKLDPKKVEEAIKTQAEKREKLYDSYRDQNKNRKNNRFTLELLPVVEDIELHWEIKFYGEKIKMVTSVTDQVYMCVNDARNTCNYNATEAVAREAKKGGGKEVLVRGYRTDLRWIRIVDLIDESTFKKTYPRATPAFNALRTYAVQGFPSPAPERPVPQDLLPNAKHTIIDDTAPLKDRALQRMALEFKRFRGSVYNKQKYCEKFAEIWRDLHEDLKEAGEALKGTKIEKPATGPKKASKSKKQQPEASCLGTI